MNYYHFCLIFVILMIPLAFLFGWIPLIFQIGYAVLGITYLLLNTKRRKNGRRKK